MIQSAFVPTEATPFPGLHVAVIMDGNGRWAARQGAPRAFGHRAGAGPVRSTVEAAPALGIGTLTLYAFSSDNWRRPEAEVRLLLELLREHLVEEAPRLADSGVRLTVIGRRDRLPLPLLRALTVAERVTEGGCRLDLRIAIDYSSRDAILAAAASIQEGTPPTRATFERAVASSSHSGRVPAVPVDLLIRTGGERRLSDFLLWESAYAEILFLETPWPDFGPSELEAALSDFQRRDRRFGGLTVRES